VGFPHPERKKQRATVPKERQLSGKSLSFIKLKNVISFQVTKLQSEKRFFDAPNKKNFPALIVVRNFCRPAGLPLAPS
jgi:hypothetical protein